MRRLLIVALLAVLTASCGDSKDNDEVTHESRATTSTRIGGVSAIDRGSSIAADGLEVEINDNYFTPNIINGTPKQEVTLEMTNKGKAMHNFSVTGSGVDKDFAANSHAQVKIAFPANGEVVFFCKYHREESQMVGVLRVS